MLQTSDWTTYNAATQGQSLLHLTHACAVASVNVPFISVIIHDRTGVGKRANQQEWEWL